MEFQKFNKIPRLSRDIVITEKIDGTNAQIFICTLSDIHNSFAGDYQNQDEYTNEFIVKYCLSNYAVNGFYMFAGSRSRWLDTSSKGDNYGFAKWVQANAEELLKLGEGRFYGEWYGKGIQRNYGLDEKRFVLFNVKKWVDKYDSIRKLENDKQQFAPNCCRVVPILYQGEFNTFIINNVLEDLDIYGSSIVPGFIHPEGIIIYHKASGQLFKKTICNDEKPKGLN